MTITYKQVVGNIFTTRISSIIINCYIANMALTDYNILRKSSMKNMVCMALRNCQVTDGYIMVIT